MEFIKSERGKSKLVYKGFIYVKQKELANNVISCKCEKRRNGIVKPKLKHAMIK